MAEQDGEKSQEPTQHRRQQAREQGQVAKSHDLSSAALLVLAVVGLMLIGRQSMEFFRQYSQRQLQDAGRLSADVSYVTSEFYWLLSQLSWSVLPLLGLLVLGAVLIDVAQVGFLLLPDKLSPDITRLDPIRGLQRLFSMNNVARLGFGLFKIAIVAGVAAVALFGEQQRLLGLSGMALPVIAAILTEVLLWTALKVGIALLILALLDYGYQWWRQEQDLKMTPQELREEMKNLEGNPQIASRRRYLQRQMAMHRVSTAVPKADVVVTNPTELAVAIQYDPEPMAAPIIVAKGAGQVADRIRKIALEHGIPVLERKPLARALYKEVEVNHPVPADKYAAVAEVLAYVYQLKGKKIPHPPTAA